MTLLDLSGIFALLGFVALMVSGAVPKNKLYFGLALAICGASMTLFGADALLTGKMWSNNLAYLIFRSTFAGIYFVLAGGMALLAGSVAIWRWWK